MNTFSPHPILEYCTKPLECENQKELFSCCQNVASSLLKEEIDQYASLKISVYEGIFCHGKSIGELTRKRYPNIYSDKRKTEQLSSCLFVDLLLRGSQMFIFPIVQNNGRKLLPPKIIKGVPDRKISEIPKDSLLYKRLKKLEKTASNLPAYPISAHLTRFGYLASKKRPLMEMKTAAAIMDIASKDLAFVTRFNAETFFKDADTSVFGRSVLCLSEKQDVAAFTALYAIALYGLTFEDIYRVEQVFGFTDGGIRSKDAQKRQAAMELIKLLEEKSPLTRELDKMAQALIDLPLPPLEVKNPILTAENYVNYFGAAAIGSAFLKSVINNGRLPPISRNLYESAAKKSEIMSDYQSALRLCAEIQAGGGSLSPKISQSLKETENLQQTVKEEINAKL